jgi:hypothetical protein
MSTANEINAYFDGMSTGMWMCASLKCGTKYVGSYGKLLSRALAEVEEERAAELKVTGKL